MKALFWLLLLWPMAALSEPYPKNPDFFLQTRTDERSLNWLVEKTRILLDNNEINDPLEGTSTISNDPSFFLDELSDGKLYRELKSMIGGVFQVDLERAQIRLRIPNLQYAIEKLEIVPSSLTVEPTKLGLKVRARLRGLNLALSSGLQADLMIPNPSTGKLESYLTGKMSPIMIQIPQSIAPIEFGVEFETILDQVFRFRFLDAELEEIPQYVEKNNSSFVLTSIPRQAPFGIDDLMVNPVVVKLNHLSRSLEFSEFKNFLHKKMPVILKIVYRTLGVSIRNTLGPRLLNTVFDSKVRSDFEIKDSGLFARFSTTHFTQPERHQLTLAMKGDLCLEKNFLKNGLDCAKQEAIPVPVREISEADQNASLSEVSQAIEQRQADVAVSISEPYINRLLKKTIQAGLWDEHLKEDHLTLGSKGAFLVFDEATQNPALYLDLIYHGGKGIEKILINPRRPIRFPLRLSTALRFYQANETINMELKIIHLLSDEYEIMNGISEYDLPSKLTRIFRRKVARTIKKMGKEVEGKIALDMTIPSLKNVDLDRARYEVSPHGRIHLFFSL